MKKKISINELKNVIKSEILNEMKDEIQPKSKWDMTADSFREELDNIPDDMDYAKLDIGDGIDYNNINFGDDSDVDYDGEDYNEFKEETEDMIIDASNIISNVHDIEGDLERYFKEDSDAKRKILEALKIIEQQADIVSYEINNLFGTK